MLEAPRPLRPLLTPLGHPPAGRGRQRHAQHTGERNDGGGGAVGVVDGASDLAGVLDVARRRG